MRLPPLNTCSRWSIILLLLVGLGTRPVLFAAEKLPASAAKEKRPSAIVTDLSSILEPLRQTNRLPALAAAVVKQGQTIAVGAVGLRRAGGSARVTTRDKFHIGSCTKSMTAVLAARLIEEKRLSWTTTIGDVFPDLMTGAQPAWRDVAIEQLLGHRGGAPNKVERSLWKECWGFQGSALDHRLLLVKGTLRQEPEAAPGTKYIYSNTGYAIAGAMLERIVKQPWETMLREKLLIPLGMTSAGFGAPATPAQEDQPWGHVLDKDELKPIPPGPGADNPAAIGPGGTVHCSIIDLARYAAFHLAGARGQGILLRPESFTKLHTPQPGQSYALGWDTAKRQWAGGTALTHTGSNTMFFAVMWLAPARDFAVVVATNLGGNEAAQACDDTAWRLIQEFLK
jgi:CubicO group peptidase (beta-lactamase class C family)